MQTDKSVMDTVIFGLSLLQHNVCRYQWITQIGFTKVCYEQLTTTVCNLMTYIGQNAPSQGIHIFLK